LWNSNGLTQHRDELDILLHNERIDLALITETHFTDRSYLRIQDYTLYRTDHPDGTAHGGAAILIKNSLSHFPLPSFSSGHLQATSISLKFHSYSVTFSASYWPPNKQVTQTQFMSYFHSLGPKFIAGGDYNAKHPQWGCRTSNPRGITLLSTLSSTNFQILSPSHPTYWPTSRSKLPDILDYFVTSFLSPQHYTIENRSDLSSDHSPIVLTVHESPVPKDPPPSLICGQVDWNAFRKYVNGHIDLNIRLKTTKDIDDTVNKLTSIIQEACWHSTIPSRKKMSNQDFYLPKILRLLIAQKRRARNRWQQSRRQDDKKELNRLTNKLKHKLTQYRQAHEHYKLASLNTTDKSLWSATKRILKYKTTNLPLRLPNGDWATSDGEIASVFAQYLSHVFSNNGAPTSPVDQLVTENLNVPFQLTPPPKAFSPSDVEHTITNLKKRKAPGYDLITAEILSQLPKKAIVLITYLYNSILRTTYFPLLWKFSIIKMLPKPNKPSHNPSSFRPISLLPLLGKIFEKLLLRRLYPILESQNIIPDHQFGFRSQHSTIQQCYRVTDAISTSLELGEYCTGAFLDISKAFDKVWHLGLLSKLKNILPFTYFLILKSFLSQRFFRVSYGSSLSPVYPVLAGVPQGSILGPLLYTLYTSDIPIHPHTLLSSFADDTAVLSQNKDPNLASQHLQEHLTSLESWLNNWKLTINVEKSQQTTFTLKKSLCPPVFLNNTPLPTKDVVRYLGLFIDKRLTWNPHTRLKRLELKRRNALLYKLLGGRSPLSFENKVLLYKTVLRPLWTYGLELWGSTKPSNLKRIQSLQSRILRTIAKAPFYISNLTLHNDLQIPYVQDLARSRYQSFHNKLPSHPNPLAQALSSPTLSVPRRLKRQWPRDLL